MLCEEQSLRVSTLLKGLVRRHAQKKHYSIQQKLTLSSSLECTPRLHSKIKVPAAQFRTAYCPTLKGFDIHTKKHYITQQKLTLSCSLECTSRLHSKVQYEGSQNYTNIFTRKTASITWTVGCSKSSSRTLRIVLCCAVSMYIQDYMTMLIFAV